MVLHKALRVQMQGSEGKQQGRAEDPHTRTQMPAIPRPIPRPNPKPSDAAAALHTASAARALHQVGLAGPHHLARAKLNQGCAEF